MSRNARNTIFVSVGMTLSVMLLLLSWFILPAMLEQRSKLQLEAKGVNVAFVQPIYGSGFGSGPFRSFENNQPQGTEPFRKWFGGCLTDDIVCVDGERSADFHQDGGGLRDEDLIPLKNLPSIEVLILGNNPITDSGLKHLSNLMNLRELDLASTEITDDGLQYLTALPKLEVLCLEFTNVTDDGLKTIAKIKSLRDLSLMGTKVLGPGLTHLAENKTLKISGVGNQEQ